MKKHRANTTEPPLGPRVSPDIMHAQQYVTTGERPSLHKDVRTYRFKIFEPLPPIIEAIRLASG